MFTLIQQKFQQTVKVKIKINVIKLMVFKLEKQKLLIKLKKWKKTGRRNEKNMYNNVNADNIGKFAVTTFIC